MWMHRVKEVLLHSKKYMHTHRQPSIHTLTHACMETTSLSYVNRALLLFIELVGKIFKILEPSKHFSHLKEMKVYHFVSLLGEVMSCSLVYLQILRLFFTYWSSVL